MSDVIRVWRPAFALRAGAIVLMGAPLALDVWSLYYGITGRDGGIPFYLVVMLLALSALFITVLIRILRAEIVLTEASLRFKNLSQWVEISLGDVEQFDITRSGLLVTLRDGTTRTAYALQRPTWSSKSEDAYILDETLANAHRSADPTR
jgi:hypothetical protein